MITLVALLAGIIAYLLLMLLDNLMSEGNYSKPVYKKALEKIEGKKSKQKKAIKSVRYIDRKEYMKILVPTAIVTFVFTFLFFMSSKFAIVFTFFSVFYPTYVINKRKRDEKKLLNYQFRDALVAICNSIKAGASLSNAFIVAENDLKKIYNKKKAKPIVYEMTIVAESLRMGVPVERVLDDFKKRADIEDITDFVNIAIITKKQGGNLAETIEKVTAVISDRIQVENEISTLVAGKRMEAKLLTVSPVALVFLISIASPEYMAPMYNTLMGRIMLLVGLILIIINYFVGKKITEIEI